MADKEILEWAPKYPSEINVGSWMYKVFTAKNTAFVRDYAATNIMENFADLTALYFMFTRVISTGFPQNMRYKQLEDNMWKISKDHRKNNEIDDVSVVRHIGAAIAIEMGGIVKPKIGMADLNSPSDIGCLEIWLQRTILRDFSIYV